MTAKRLGRLVSGLAMAVMLLALPSAASAQTGMLRGKVTDPEGKPIEGAKITISSKTVKSSREVKSNKKGEWIQIGLYPGEYLVTAEKGDLKAQGEARVSLGENPPLEMQLGRGGATSEEAAKRQAALQKMFDEGVAASRAGKFDESIAKFTEAAGMAPNCADCYYNIGYAHSQKQEWAQAEAAYRKAVEIKPDYAEAWTGLSNVLNQQGKADEALAASEKAAAAGGGAGGGNANALYNQGVILWNQNKFAEAKEKFAAAVKADPNYGEAYYRLGMAHVNLGEMDAAVTAFEGYLKAAPDGPHAAEVKGFLAAMKK
ncbi:MAG TPA: tetratricopeptide repeat protein [Vicinamibacterales bacterium]